MDIDNNKNDTQTNRKYAGILIRIGRIITFIAAVFLLVMLISEGTISGVTTADSSGILLIVFACIALAGYVLSLWKVGYAGILLAAISIAFAIHIAYYLGSGQFAAWAMMGLPHLVAGGLLLAGWRVKKK